jgi:hypothetical protein
VIERLGSELGEEFLPIELDIRDADGVKRLLSVTHTTSNSSFTPRPSPRTTGLPPNRKRISR